MRVDTSAYQSLIDRSCVWLPPHRRTSWFVNLSFRCHAYRTCRLRAVISSDRLGFTFRFKGPTASNFSFSRATLQAIITRRVVQYSSAVISSCSVATVFRSQSSVAKVKADSYRAVKFFARAHATLRGFYVRCSPRAAVEPTQKP